MIKPRKIRWAEHVARMREIRNSYKISVGRPEGKRPSADLGVDRRITLKWMSGKWGWRVWILFIWLRIGTGGGLL
jgi:hypothetical protein